MLGAGDLLGYGRIVVEVEDDVRQNLARIESDVERTMRKLKREQAAIKLDDSQVKKKLKEADARLRKWERKKYEAEISGDTKGLDKAVKGIATARKKIDELTDAQDKNHRALLNNLDAQRAASERLTRAREDGAKKIAKAEATAAQKASDVWEEAHKLNRKYDKERIDAYTSDWDAAIREDIKRTKRAADAFDKEWDAALKENFKRTKKFADDWDYAHYLNELHTKRAAAKFDAAWDAAIKEDIKRTKRATDAFDKEWDAALKEDWKRSKKYADEWDYAHHLNEVFNRRAAAKFDAIWDDAIKEDMRRTRRAAEAFDREWDAALKEDFKRSKKFADDWDYAHHLNEVYNRRAAAQFNADWDAAIQENERRAREYARAWDAAHKEEDRRNIASWKLMLSNEKLKEDAQKRAIIGNTAEEKSIADLNAAYLKANQNLRKLHGQRTPFRQEEKQTLEINTARAEAEIAALAAQIRALGHDPIEIKFRTDRSALSRVEGFVRKTADRMAGLGDVSVRFGPFTSSLKGFAASLVVLGPIITSLVGSLSSLVGVIGGGLTGAAITAGGAFTGLGMAFTGVFLAVKPVVKQYSAAADAAEKYDKAVIESGKNSEDAKDAYKDLQKILGNVSKETANNFREAQKLGPQWAKLTEGSRASAFNVMGRGIKFAGDNMGWFAMMTNTATKSLSDGLIKWMDRLDSEAGRGVLMNLFDSFNKSIPHIMNGLGNLAAYLGKVFSVGANEGQRLSGVFEHWTDELNKGFDPGKVSRLIGYARELGRFLLAGGRAFRKFFGLGAEEGSKFLQDMTHGLNEWTSAMSSGEGRDKMLTFFREARENTQALWSFIKPIAGQFITWATNLAPVVTGFMKVSAAVASGVGWLLRIVESMGKLVGMNNALSTLAGTLGIIWGIGKWAAVATAVGSFVGKIRGLITVLGVLRGAMAAAIGMRSLSAGLAVASAGFASMRKQAALAAASTKGVGTAAAGLSRGNIWAGLAVGALVAFDQLQSASDHWLDEARKLNDSARSTVDSFDNLTDAIEGTNDALMASYDNKRYSRDAVKVAAQAEADAQSKVNRMREQGLQGTKRYADAVADLRNKEQALTSARTDLRESEQQVEADRKKSLQESIDRQRELEGAIQDSIDAQKKLEDFEVDDSAVDRAFGGTQWKDVLAAMEDVEAGGEDAVAALVEMGMHGDRVGDAFKNIEVGDSLREQLMTMVEGGGRLGDAAEEYLEALNNSEDAIKKINREQDLRVLAELNAARFAKDYSELSTKAARSFASISRNAGKLGGKITTTIATKYENPQNAEKIGRQAASALKRGADAKVVYRIIADSKSAEQTIARLNAMNIPFKKMKVIEEGGDAAIKMVEKIIGRKLEPKEARIISKGGPEALNWASRVKAGYGNIPDSVDTVISAIDQATAIANAVKVTMSILDAIRVVIDIVAQKSGSGWSGLDALASGAYSGGFRAFAAGGRSDGALVADAHRQAAKLKPSSSPGGRYSKPTLLVGEERRREYVIATNPAYRQRNKTFLKQAAGEFGYKLLNEKNGEIVAAKGGKGPDKLMTTGPDHSRDKSRYKDTKGVKGKKFKTTKQIRAGAVPIDQVKKPLTAVEAEIKRRGSTEDSLRKSLADKLDAYEKMKKTRGESNKSFSNRKDRAADSIERDRDSLDALKFGDNTAKGLRKESMKDLKEMKKRLGKRVRAVEKVNDNIAEQTSRANQFATEMNTDATRYENTGQGKWLTEWTNDKKSRDDALKELNTLYTKAIKFAKPGTPFYRDLKEKLADIEDQQASSEYATAPEPESLDLEGYLRQLGKDSPFQYSVLQGYLRDVAKAKVVTPEVLKDDPATTDKNERTDSLTDDLAAAEAIEKFYTDLWKSDKFDSLTVEQKTQLFEALGAAREATQTVKDAIAGTTSEPAQPTEDPDLLRDTARYEAIRTYGSNAAALGSAPGGTVESAGYSSPSPNSLRDPGGGGGGYAGRSSGYSGLSTGGGSGSTFDPASGNGPNISAGAARSIGSAAAAGVSSGMAAAPKTTNNNVTINNSFPTPPPDPHTWSAGVGYEMGGML